MPALPASLLARPIAHRGLHDRAAGVIENSPAAFAAAIAAGYGIELDLQLSADGVAMVFHDDSLDRLTGESGPVRDRDAAALGRIALTGSQGGDRIPTLAAVLEQVAGRVPLLIELKDQSQGQGSATPALERTVAATLAGYAGDVAVMSFNPAMIAAMAKLAPDLSRGITSCAFDPAEWPALAPDTCAMLREIGSFDAVGAAFISHDWHDLASPVVAALKARGVPILCWTVKSAEVEQVARRVADQITFEGYAA
ncbi:glycerophosphodiester phosphodiesterase family protein [Roseicyclus sp.]|uniref:glycerophosphodiester phosphodiesterase family protein n=1 Tax=Roseicyclus sp. TaxID=1914329 RepID=UPI003F6C0AC5